MFASGNVVKTHQAFLLNFEVWDFEYIFIV